MADVCTRNAISWCELESGASHDSQFVARVVPTALLFVPSAKGLSHVPTEWTSVRAIARGADVLAASLVELDKLTSGFEEWA